MERSSTRTTVDQDRVKKGLLKHLIIQNLLRAIHTDKLHADSGCTGYYQLWSIWNCLLQHHDCPYEKTNRIQKK